MRKISTTTWIIVAMLLGIMAGYICHEFASNKVIAKEIASYFSILTDIFLRLVKVVIAPLVFGTLVSGIAGMKDSSSVGRIGIRSLGCFVVVSLLSLALGMFFVNALQVGSGLNISLPTMVVDTNISTNGLNLKDFVSHLIPSSFFDAMAKNEVLQILVFSLLFGFGLSSVKGEPGRIVTTAIDGLVHSMLKVTDYVMRLAPIGIFGSIAAVITEHGFGILATYGSLLLGFYAGLAALWVCLFGIGYIVLRRSIFTLIRLLKSPIIMAFSTASSEAAYPRIMEQLGKFGVNSKITSFVLPLGYSFNLGGSMMYQAFATIFIAQAYNIDIPFTQQLIMLLVLMVSSKGMAGVPRGSLVVVAAALPMFHLPEAGILLIIGIDQFLDMGRTATNVLGNGIATSVIAKWESDLEGNIINPFGEQNIIKKI